MIQTSLNTLTKIRESRLEQVFSGKIAHGVDKEGNIFIDVDPNAFRSMLNYVSSDRAWLPADADARKLAENEIKRWGLEKGLDEPSSNCEGGAEESQQFLDCEIDLSDTIVNINVGGKVVPTSVSTLRKIRGYKLEQKDPNSGNSWSRVQN